MILPSAQLHTKEVQERQERLILSPNATATEQLSAINHYMPTTQNLAENLTALHHLGLTNRSITEILSGGCHYLSGEITSLKHSTVKVICCGVKATIADIDGRYQVCLEGKPIEGFINAERERQRGLEKMVTESTKEDLVKEIRILRREIKHLSEILMTTKHQNVVLMECLRLSDKK